MLVLVALAVLEELLWDALVFRDYLPALCRNMTAAKARACGMASPWARSSVRALASEEGGQRGM